MIGYPFDSHVEYDEHDIPIFDRAISSKPLKNLIAKLFSNGVLPNPSTNLQVVSGGDGMTVIVKAGFCIINGGLKLEDEDKTLVVQASDATYPRIDTVVMRWNDNDDVRACDLYVIEGTPSASPVRSNLTRTESVYELGLADIYITARSTSIDSFRITDTRLDTNRCGYVSSISEFDTSTLYAQIQSDLNNFQENEQADFLAWFEEMRDQLSEDAAGHLQNEIDEVNGRYNGLTQDIAEWIVLNQLPQIGRDKTLYLITGEEEAHYLGDVSDDTSIIDDGKVSNGTTYSSNKITNLLGYKVDAEAGKRLSTNDLTNDRLQRLLRAITNVKTINGQSIVGDGNIEIQGGSGTGITTEIKDALLEAFSHVAWSTPNGQSYFDNLVEALEGGVVKEVVSISATKQKVDYYTDENLIISDIIVTALYSDGSQKDVTADSAIHQNAVDMSVVGTQLIPINYEYNGKVVSTNVAINITVRPATTELTSIVANKTDVLYNVGETVDISDITVIAYYSDDTHHEVSGFTVDTSGVDTTTVGIYNIPVSYEEGGITKTTNIEVAVQQSGRTPRGEITMTWTDDKKINQSTGKVSSASGYTCTEGYTRLYDDMQYTVASSTASGNTLNTIFYDSTKTYLTYNQTKNGKLTIPTNAVYARFSIYPTSAKSQFHFVESAGE